MEVAGAAVGGLTGFVYDLFGYNRKNFQFDRQQRNKMEYQLSEMRMKQTDLWREDVRQAMELTPKKLEIYITIIALELMGIATCLCKGRVPPGAPPWLVGAGVLAVCSAITFLFLGLWFGLHAFVSAQAYKVRILTQLVRLPVPSWSAMEAARTYGSDFESMKASQMLRVPIVGGAQERYVPDSSDDGPEGATQAAADPWGLERRGDGIVELDPGVNGSNLEKQRHIWLVRESAKFFNTYDAFCRVCMNAGTSQLSVFFCFWCLAYTCTELAAPVGAWAGMFIFTCITLLLLRTDQILSAKQYFVGSVLLFFSPVFCAVVTFMSSKNWGNPGNIEYLVPLGLFLKGCWFLYFLHFFKAAEHQTGAVLPRSFRAVLYLDPFGWAKHTSAWWQGIANRASFARVSVRGRGAAAQQDASLFRSTKNKLPATCMSDSSRPLRPEDAKREVNDVQAATLVANPADQDEEDEVDDEQDSHHFHAHAASFRPGTFANFKRTTSQGSADEDQVSGADVASDRAGIQPWRAFFFNTVLLAVMWWCASFVALYDVSTGKAEFRKAHYGLPAGEVAPLPVLLGTKVRTGWGSGFAEPHGFTCDLDGTVFATAGRNSLGHRSVLQGLLSEDGSAVNFSSAPECLGLHADSMIQDLALNNCESSKLGRCNAIVLPARGQQLLSCPLSLLDANGQAKVSNMSSLVDAKLARSWLEDRGGSPLDEHSDLGHLLHPEELTALNTMPCSALPSDHENHNCLVVGTTARRIVHLGGSSKQSDAASWLPRRLLQKEGLEVPGPGSFAILSGGRFLGVLHRDANTVNLLDLHAGGRPAGSWKLPRPMPDGSTGSDRFAGICAGGGALFALQAGASPSVWRFPHPQLPTAF